MCTRYKSCYSSSVDSTATATATGPASATASASVRVPVIESSISCSADLPSLTLNPATVVTATSEVTPLDSISAVTTSSVVEAGSAAVVEVEAGSAAVVEVEAGSAAVVEVEAGSATVVEAASAAVVEVEAGSAAVVEAGSAAVVEAETVVEAGSAAVVEAGSAAVVEAGSAAVVEAETGVEAGSVEAVEVEKKVEVDPPVAELVETGGSSMSSIETTVLEPNGVAGDSEIEESSFDGNERRNQEIILLNIGLTDSIDGNEIRIILSTQKKKEYITIRDACVPYSDLKEIMVAFDASKRETLRIRQSHFIRSHHVFYARLYLFLVSYCLYQYTLWQAFYGFN
jgi:hypothetical protein